MTTEHKPSIGRRDFLRVLGGSAAAVAATLPLAGEAKADTETNEEKLRARYQANSADVKNHYRVNRYPR